MKSNLQLSIEVIAALCVILAATTAVGRLALRVGQPRVVGEMVAGVLLGPSLLGAVAPSVQQELFPDDVKGVLYTMSIVGLTFYMFLVGIGIDHELVGRDAVRRATALAFAGLLPAFALGGAVAAAFHEELAVPGSSRLVFMLFLGGALSITAFPMLARILEERGVANSRFGSLTLMAGAIDDAAAWVLLAVITALATAGNVSEALPTVVGGVAFTAVMLTIGRRLLRLLAHRVERAGAVEHDTMAIVLLTVVAAGWFTELIGIFSVFGGFVTGVAMPHSPLLRRELRARLTDVNLILLLPVFFAFSGLNTQLRGLESVNLLVPFLAVVVAAYVGKYVGCTLVVRGQGFSWRHASAIGGLMNARGLMILVFINIGLAYGVITTQMFSMLVLVAVLTTATALPIYRLSLPPHLEEAVRHETVRPVATAPDAARRPPADDAVPSTHVAMVPGGS